MIQQDVVERNEIKDSGLEKLAKGFTKKLIAQEISKISRYSNSLSYIHAFKMENSEFLDLLDAPVKSELPNLSKIEDFSQRKNYTHVTILDGTLNYSYDIHKSFEEIYKKSNRHSRVIAICYNPYLRGLYGLANFFGMRKGPLPTTFIKMSDLQDLAKATNFEVVRTRLVGYCPFEFLGLGSLINKLFSLLPFLQWLSLVSVITLRPIKAEVEAPSLTIVIPARNEKGNIENALKRIPNLGTKFTEVIFVEGHSSDQTWEEIQRVIPLYSDKFKIQAFKQDGKGKNDAVRVGFAKSTGDVLTILDADLTMPPELLYRYFDSYKNGMADFVNGSRLLYEMEGEAMRFLNKLGNIFFAKSLSFVLQANLSDSLCGTKLVSAHDYKKIVNWRNDFGDFDPFGDFELLFPASILGLGIVNVPIRYLARTYGSTNIRRFYHGAMLLKMSLIGLIRVR